MWEQFWDRFKTTVHQNSSLSYAERWEYLHQALKDGPAKDSLSGFSRSEAQYDDAVEWLIECYHQPQEVIKQHTRTIAVCSRQEATHVYQACSFFNYYYYLTLLNK